MNRGRLLPSFPSPEFVGDLRIAQIIFVEVKHVQAQPVLYLTLTQIMQVRPPVPVFGQVVRHMPGQQNMPGIAAIHNALGDIDSRSCYVGFVINIGDSIDRAAVNTHPQLNVRMISQGFANLQRTSHRLFRTLKKKERHPVPCRHANEFTVCFRRLETLGVSYDPI